MSTIEKALQKNKAMQSKPDAEKKTSLEAAQEKANELAAQQQAATDAMTASAEVEAAAQSKQPATDAPLTASVRAEETPEVPTQENPLPVENAVPPVMGQPMPPTSSAAISSANSKKKFISLSNVQKEGFVSNIGRHTINEEYRAIKRKVLSNAFGPLAKTLNNANIVMVSSPNPNEGKTFTAINLALSIALEQDKTVLLVDADVLRPSVMKTLDQPFESGLMEYLLGEIDDLSEVIHHTNLETLKIIPAGKSHHLSTELLASEKMLESVSEFAHRYPDRVVIIDSPPLLGINETAILANLAGQAVVVVQEGKTSLNRLSQAVDHLNPDMAKGFVINKAKASSKDSPGYYGYYYGSDE
ncbi:XrtA-associated tyrosine autokinase [Aliiglaciecola litoralis]|uniref:XrtA-associated tyrosine autokinase n=1 Tax=Aliiglaciecola litoralis TaxID=582857 RepID=A0ABN1LJP2_9ALTE